MPTSWTRLHQLIARLEAKGQFLVAAAVLFFVFQVVRTAWVVDDAFITMRTVDNFVNGHGLTWNIAERVQTYTHPLWMFLCAVVYFVVGHPYGTLVGTSLVVSVAAVVLFARGFNRSTLASCAGVLILCISNAFVDYSTSGLENPLSHILLLGFLYLLFFRDPSFKTLMLLSVLAGASAINRLDTLILVTPALLVVAAGLRPLRRAVLSLLVGFSPLALWLLFSLFYYGFLFPNTAYAKLNTTFSLWTNVKHGVFYLLHSVSVDPATLFIVIAGILFAVSSRQRKNIAVALGISLYLLYIVRIGGDFMSGRFLSTPMLCALVLLSRTTFHGIRIPVFVATALLLTLVGHYSLFGKGFAGVVDEFHDERDAYFPHAGLVNLVGGTLHPRHRWVDWGRDVRRSNDKVVHARTDGIGFLGFYAGPDVHILDTWAISDPLLARIPGSFAMVGHYHRSTPKGYLETVRTGKNAIIHPELAAYYDKLSLITRGDLLSWGRVRTIVAFNLGHHDHLMRAYLHR